MNSLKVLIVDDEPLARTRLKTMLQVHQDVVIVGSCDNGTDAVRIIGELQPDLVFLDIMMPGLDGFEVVDSVDRNRPPAIVFVTANNERAVDAFDIDAIDYILKPFDRVRLARTLDRVRSQIEPDRVGQTDLFVDQIQTATKHNQLPQRLAVKSGSKIRLVSIDQIDWIESAGNYVRIHHNGQQSLLRESLKRLASMLDPQNFARIHRTTIINLNLIECVEPTFHGDFLVTLKTGVQLPLSRSYKSILQNRFEC